MKILIKLALTSLIGVTVMSITATADVAKGQKIYSKTVKPQCNNMTGSNFAGKHTQDQWEEIYDAGKLGDEISKICGGFKLNEKLHPHLYDFAYEYANDSGNVPSC
ncbi:MAG TPA: cytochrome C [Campylobacterales bacterium]|nr:cytochrome C [Campylobacterales bacterium]HIP41700.1 cytochrome C [Campylobacterales bacterium]